MKPSKETLMNSYINVKGWSDEDVKKAAEWLAGESGLGVGNLEVYEDYHYLVTDGTNKVVWVVNDLSCYHKQITNLFNIKEEPMNTLESLKKAKQELSFAKDCLKASQEAVEEAQKAYTDAYKAFKEEADGLLREEDNTPDMSSDEDSVEWFVAMYNPVDDCFDDLPMLTPFTTYTTKKYGDGHFVVYFKGKGLFFDFDSFCKRFKRVAE